MQTADFFEVILYVVALLMAAPPLGFWMARVFQGERTFLTGLFGGLERAVYRLCGVDETKEMSSREYERDLILFHIVGLTFLFFIQMGQKILPLNPQGFEGLSWHLSLNTAISFVTNTNWQAYSGEATMSYLTQMLGLGVQNFLSAATGVSVFLVLVRGLVRQQTQHVGNFWVDLTRATLYVFLPLSMILALILSQQGVIQNFQTYHHATTLEGAEQIIPGGPAASQVAIKQLGTNGGGFFGANSAHPFENPTPFSNFLQVLAILLVPAALAFTFGRMVGSVRQGVTLFLVMFGVWLAGFGASLWFEVTFNPILQNGSVMEGKEVRIGVTNSVLWATATTAASSGSVNAMHSSLSPLAGGIAMFNIMLGEIIFGGVGSGMYGMLLFVLLTVFLSGLMVGRSPEYLGKRIESAEMKWVLVGILAPCATILIGAAVTTLTPAGLSSLTHQGPHGFSEILYAWSSAAGNNGSAFAGLSANTHFYNLLLGAAMLVGRFAVMIPMLAVAGSLVRKKKSPASAGTFTTDTVLFGGLLIGVILIVGALTFLPALSLGPIVEQLFMLNGRPF